MLNRTVPPPFNRSSTFDLFAPETQKLKNGIDAFFIQGGNQDVIKIELVFLAGRWSEDAWGAAYFASQLLSKGTSKKSSFEIANIFDQYGAHLEISPGLDFTSISLYSLTRNIEPTFNLLIELLLEASSPEKELELLKSIYLQNLKVNSEKTSFLASKVFRKSLFGETHPYGKELEENDVVNFSRQSAVQHAQKFDNKGFAFVSGKFDANTHSIVVNLLERLPVRKHEALADKKSVTNSADQIQNKEGSVQASIRMGRKSVLRSHKDYTDILFLTHILGGYFGSRLMKNIREEKGLTYGIHASINALKYEGYVVIGADVNKENVTLTIDEISKELKRLRTEKIGDDELETSRNHFIGGLQSEVTTAFAHAEKIRALTIFGLDHDFYRRMIQRIDAIQAEVIIKTAEEYFSEDSFLKVAVG